MKVAVAIIRQANGDILLTQRAAHARHGGGLWEFPGGKLHQNESGYEALVRELKEELAIEVLQANHLGNVDYVYPSHAVQLMVFDVSSYTGTPMCQADQLDMQWVAAHRLPEFQLLDANRTIIERFIATTTALA